MSVALNPFVSRYINKVSELAEGEVTMLWGVKDDLQKLVGKLETIKSVLVEAEKRSIQDGLVKRWLDKLRDAMYDADNIADRCSIEIKRGNHTALLEHRISPPTASVRSLPLFGSIAFGHRIGRRIRSLNNKLDSINKERRDFHLETPVANSNQHVADRTSQLPPEDTVGIDDDTKRLVEIVDAKEWEVGRTFTVFAILGPGGIGKTTLAQKVFNDKRIKNQYQLRVWLHVSKIYSVPGLLKEMIRMSGGDHGQSQTTAELEPILVPLLSGKRIFLVLDDIWEFKSLSDELKRVLKESKAAPGIRVLVTTRLDDVPIAMHAVHSHQVRKMSLSGGWDLLCKKLQLQGETEIGELKDIGIEFVKRCRCLPLAIIAVAGVLNTKLRRHSEWRKVFESNAWFTGGGELPQEVRGALYLSYDDLLPHLKDCFHYLALFPDGFCYLRKDLARLWVAEGYVEAQGAALLEDLAEDCYEQLVQRNILQRDPEYLDGSRCTIHDLFRELAVSLAGGESCFGAGTSDVPRSNGGTATNLRRLSLTSSPATREAAAVLTLPPNLVREPKRLRTLMLYTGLETKAVGKDLFKKVRRLRVMDLSLTGIVSLPDSLHHLIHLRLLDLGGTGITELPESIGDLCSLQTLDLSYCEFLYSLPQSITLLRSLRCLRLVETPVSYLPAGIRRLEHLNHLEGFVVGEQQQGVCGLEELEDLSQLRFLHVHKLERAPRGVVSVLANKPHLRDLSLDYTPCKAASVSSTGEEMARIEQTLDKLSPPECLEALTIRGFFGHKIPSWMLLPVITNLRLMTKLYLHGCASWQHFPELGQLPSLRTLTIVGAEAVVTVGPEFLGFPVLEILKIFDMPNWEVWSTCSRDKEWMPRLQQLGLKHCPKLNALPESLRHARALELLHIEGAHKLRTIQDLFYNSSSANLKSLQLLNNRNLETISNLPALKELMIRDCNLLEHVEGVHNLQSLHLIDRLLLGLPVWLEELVNTLQELRLECQDHLFLRCIKHAGHWSHLSQVPVVSIVTNYGCSAYLYYTKAPESYQSNVHAVE